MASMQRIALIGGGQMARALASGLRTAAPNADMVVCDINESQRRGFADVFSCRTTDNAAEAMAGNPEIVVLAVKPQNLDAVAKTLRGNIGESSMLLSVLAGTTVENLVETLDPKGAVVRAMPNTPAMIGKGMTVWTGADMSAPDKEMARMALASLGEELFVEDEHFLDIATAISGSGPAYSFMFMESMIETGVHMGFSRANAEKLVQTTMQGAVEYAIHQRGSSVGLRNDITSPAGTTAAAIYTLEKGGFRTVVSDGLWAAYRRSLELGGRDSRVGPGRTQPPPNGS